MSAKRVHKATAPKALGRKVLKEKGWEPNKLQLLQLPPTVAALTEFEERHDYIILGSLVSSSVL